MHKVLRKKEVCDKCKKVTFKEEYMTICDVCEKEIVGNSNAWKYRLRLIKEEQPESSKYARNDWELDCCSFYCFINCLKDTQGYKYESIWGFHLDKEDVLQLLEMIK